MFLKQPKKEKNMSLLVESFLFPKKPAQPAATPVNLHRPLYIEKVDPKDYALISHIAKDWASITQQKRGIIASITEPSACKQLASCKIIAEMIAAELEYAFDDSDQVYVGKEAVSDKVYGMAVLSQNDKEIYGSLLVTHPNNIQCKANHSEILRIKGVGTAFIKFVEEECTKQGKNLSFDPVDSAESFYQKFGYRDGIKSESAPISKL